MTSSSARPLTEEERQLVSLLISDRPLQLPANDLLRQEIVEERNAAEIVWHLQSVEEPDAQLSNPVTAVASDTDGGPVVIQLLASAGRVVEIAIFRVDGAALHALPVASSIHVHATSEASPGKVQHLA